MASSVDGCIALVRGRRAAGANSGSLDPVAGFAFFVEVAAVDVVDHGDREVLHLQATDGLSTEFFVGHDLRLLDAAGGAPRLLGKGALG